MLDQETIRGFATDLAREFVDRIGGDECDIESDPTGVSIAGDDWTMRLEFAGSAWVAIDNEPGDVSQFSTARNESIGEEVEQLLQEFNRQRDGLLAQLLRESGDPFSIDLAQALERQGD